LASASASFIVIAYNMETKNRNLMAARPIIASPPATSFQANIAPIEGMPLRGLWTAAVTPVDASYRCDVARLAAHCRRLLDRGCDGVALFGTTGEGPAFSAAERARALEGLLAASLPPGRLIVSASSATLPDSIELARQATKAGVAGVLLMPPFFFRDGIGDEGIFRFYAALIDQIGEPALRALLYHIPGASGVPVRPPVIRRLVERYPRTIVGIKDSGGDWGYTEELLRRFSRLAIFTGTETHIHLALQQDGAGTICGLGNVIAPLLRRLFDAPDITERQRLIPLIQKTDSMMSRGAFIACLKAWIAAETGDAAWSRLLPPMAPLPAVEAARLAADFRAFLNETD
jgi:4-hydroxy-tetrahydrodipicolinate synthase